MISWRSLPGAPRAAPTSPMAGRMMSIDNAFSAISPPTMAISSTVVRDGRLGSGELRRKGEQPPVRRFNWQARL